MFRILEITITKILLSVLCALGASYNNVKVSSVYHIVSERLNDLTITFGHNNPTTQDLQFSNNKACSRRHTTVGLFYYGNLKWPIRHTQWTIDHCAPNSHQTQQSIIYDSP